MLPWKRTRRVLTEARRRRFEVAVAVDTRSARGHREAIAAVADIVLDYHAPDDWCEAALDPLLELCTRSWVLWVSDDEEPGPALWRLAERPALRVAYRVRLVCPIDDERIYRLGTEAQVRLFPRDALRWPGRWDEPPVISVPLIELPTTVLWHYSVAAPREYREEKERRYVRMALARGRTWDGERFLWEDHPEAIGPLIPELRAQLPADEPAQEVTAR